MILTRVFLRATTHGRRRTADSLHHIRWGVGQAHLLGLRATCLQFPFKLKPWITYETWHFSVILLSVPSVTHYQGPYSEQVTCTAKEKPPVGTESILVKLIATTSKHPWFVHFPSKLEPLLLPSGMNIGPQRANLISLIQENCGFLSSSCISPLNM